MRKTKKLCKISFLQALGLTLYIALVSVIFWGGDKWFGKINNYLGPVIMLSIFTVSALISAVITLGYPFYIWQKKNKLKEAIKIVVFTSLWMIGFIILGLIVLSLKIL